MITATNLHKKGWSRAEIKHFQQHRAKHYKHHSVLRSDKQLLTLYVLVCALSALIVYFLGSILYPFIDAWIWPYFIFFLSLTLGFLFVPLAKHFLLPKPHHLYLIAGFTLGWHLLIGISIPTFLLTQAPVLPLLSLTSIIGALGYATPLLSSLKKQI